MYPFPCLSLSISHPYSPSIYLPFTLHHHHHRRHCRLHRRHDPHKPPDRVISQSARESPRDCPAARLAGLHLAPNWLN
ncbi:hypothetical protein E2C01_093072 [Portunus trituberculatus]|uniref:Uncharacterized protein n=1 Tax=Portunus trituberculatus TaxID=210409 RepID=A0A5B7JTJ7_PORTR|nr:hypothetical protein [Portunus trituberculatus]